MTTLPTKILIDAARAQAQAKGLVMTFIHQGDRDSGQILLQFFDSLAQKSQLARRERNWETGDFDWVPVKAGSALDQEEAGKYIERAIKIDPDIWVIEIEGSLNENPFA